MKNKNDRISTTNMNESMETFSIILKIFNTENSKMKIDSLHKFHGFECFEQRNYLLCTNKINIEETNKKNNEI